MEIGNIKPVGIQSVMPSSGEPDAQSASIPRREVEAAESQKAADSEKNDEKQLDKLNDAVDKLNKTSTIFDRSLQFKIHEATKELVVSVIDTTTNKVIREIPPKEVLDFVSKMRDYLGMIFDKKV